MKLVSYNDFLLVEKYLSPDFKILLAQTNIETACMYAVKSLFV